MKYKRWLSLTIYTFSSSKDQISFPQKRKEKERKLDFYSGNFRIKIILVPGNQRFLNIISKMVFFKKITFI